MSHADLDALRWLVGDDVPEPPLAVLRSLGERGLAERRTGNRWTGWGFDEWDYYECTPAGREALAAAECSAIVRT